MYQLPILVLMKQELAEHNLDHIIDNKLLFPTIGYFDIIKTI